MSFFEESGMGAYADALRANELLLKQLKEQQRVEARCEAWRPSWHPAQCALLSQRNARAFGMTKAMAREVAAVAAPSWSQDEWFRDDAEGISGNGVEIAREMEARFGKKLVDPAKLKGAISAARARVTRYLKKFGGAELEWRLSRTRSELASARRELDDMTVARRVLDELDIEIPQRLALALKEIREERNELRERAKCQEHALEQLMKSGDFDRWD